MKQLNNTDGGKQSLEQTLVLVLLFPQNAYKKWIGVKPGPSLWVTDQ